MLKLTPDLYWVACTLAATGAAGNMPYGVNLGERAEAAAGKY